MADAGIPVRRNPTRAGRGRKRDRDYVDTDAALDAAEEVWALEEAERESKMRKGEGSDGSVVVVSDDEASDEEGSDDEIAVAAPAAGAGVPEGEDGKKEIPDDVIHSLVVKALNNDVADYPAVMPDKELSTELGYPVLRLRVEDITHFSVSSFVKLFQAAETRGSAFVRLELYEAFTDDHVMELLRAIPAESCNTVQYMFVGGDSSCEFPHPAADGEMGPFFQWAGASLPNLHTFEFMAFGDSYEWDEDFIQCIENNSWPKLRNLTLKDSMTGDEGAADVVEAVTAHCPALTSLRINGDGHGPEALEATMTAAKRAVSQGNKWRIFSLGEDAAGYGVIKHEVPAFFSVPCGVEHLDLRAFQNDSPEVREELAVVLDTFGTPAVAKGLHILEFFTCSIHISILPKLTALLSRTTSLKTVSLRNGWEIVDAAEDAAAVEAFKAQVEECRAKGVEMPEEW